MKKQIIFVIGILVLLATVTVLSIYKWEAQPKDITVGQAVSQRDTALRDLKVQKQLEVVHVQAVNNQLIDTKGQVTALSSQKTTLCTQIKAAKLVQPLCQ